MRITALIILLFALIPAASADEYPGFNDFCIQNFGAELEEEVYNRFGQQLNLVQGGDWFYESETSAVIGFETSLPAKAWIEYGTTTGYGSATIPDERHFFLHLHYIRNLSPDTTYHYRIVAEDERGNVIQSGDRTFTTQDMAGAIRIPGDMTGDPPYTLIQDGATYIVTEDITANSTAINVAGDGITLDLGGHTIVYNEVNGSGDPIEAGYYGYYGELYPCGIRTSQGESTTLLNGIVRQGEGNGTGYPAGFNPLWIRQPASVEIAGITADYYGSSITGIMIDGGSGQHVHHNIVLDRGTDLLDRHSGVNGIGGVTFPCHHNLLKRVRHRGIGTRSDAEVYSNEIYIDSWATNSYGVIYYSSNPTGPINNIIISDNRIFGTGYHPIGVGSGFYAHDIEVYNNYIQMQGQAPSTYRWLGGLGGGDPTGQDHPVNGFRFHQGPQTNIDVHDNTIVVKARGVPEEGAMMRGLWITPSDLQQDVYFRNNVIKQVAQNEYADGHAVAALGGDPGNTDLNITYINNTVIANICNVRFGDNYGHGGVHTFWDTTLIKTGNDSRYATIKLGWDGYNYDTYGHAFVDSMFQGGAGYDQLSFEGSSQAYQDFTVQWRLNLMTSPGAAVIIRDAHSDTVFQGMLTDGEEVIPLSDYLQSNSGIAYLTPHNVTVTNPGDEAVSVEVDMSQPRTLEVYGSGALCENDQDGDFFGTGANCWGPDCNDSNPDLHDNISCSYDGAECGAFSLCLESCPAIPQEDCSNSDDDDCDGFSDCDDPECFPSPGCRAGTYSCGDDCQAGDPAGCSGRILADSCIVSGNCDGTNDVEDIILPDSVITGGSEITVQVDYECWLGSGPDGVAIWYHNGSGWRLLDSWGEEELSGCDRTNDGPDGTVHTEFMVGNTEGTHFVRAVEMVPESNRETSPCPAMDWGDIDDLGFTVITGYHRADSNQDGCIVMGELIDFIDHWKLDSDTYRMPELMGGIRLWKTNTGCPPS